MWKDYDTLLKHLTEREAKVINKRYGKDGNPIATLEEVAKHFEVDRERIRQIEAKAIRKLWKARLLIEEKKEGS